MGFFKVLREQRVEDMWFFNNFWYFNYVILGLVLYFSSGVWKLLFIQRYIGILEVIVFRVEMLGKGIVGEQKGSNKIKVKN